LKVDSDDDESNVWTGAAHAQQGADAAAQRSGPDSLEESRTRQVAAVGRGVLTFSKHLLSEGATG